MRSTAEHPPPLVAELGFGLVGVAALVGVLQAWLAGAPAWLAGSLVAYLGVAVAVYRFWPDARDGFGWANRVTLARAAVVAVLIGMLIRPDFLARHGILAATLGGVAIVLDGVDGWLARALDGATRFGARFDMEVDALLILALSLAVFAAGQGPVWVVAGGLMRYAFVGLGRLFPWMQRPLPDSRWRKFVCVAQGVVLAAVLLPWLAPPVSHALLALALAVLAHSFLRDVAWLARAARSDRPGREDRACGSLSDSDSPINRNRRTR